MGNVQCGGATYDDEYEVALDEVSSRSSQHVFSRTKGITSDKRKIRS
jgi:hypothetical protein